MPSDTVLLALIVAGSAAVTSALPIIINVINNRALKSKEDRDYARQDVVAKRAEEAALQAKKSAEAARSVADQAAEAARLLVQNQQSQADKAAEVARLLVESDARTREGALAASAALDKKVDVIKRQGDVIHTLVNSQLSTAIQAEFDATKRELILLLHVIELGRAAGHEPDVESLAEVDSTRKRIAELQTTVADRLKQADKAAVELQE